ncbi:UNVERIFIED_CONTAM: hypothetical protein GTU68_047188 [Idotea baltica]|nr:hypothetical protein [Idotea baltica]
MYIPDINRHTDRADIVDFIRAYPFANFISVIDGRPFATPLPFMLDIVDDQVVLLGHFAKENPHSAHLLNQDHLVIFQVPHAYITDADYIRPSVPTWNYVAIHAYGIAHIIDDDQEVRSLMMRTLHHFDPKAVDRWPLLNTEKQNALLRGIVCFKISVTDLQAKYKLSQNKMKQERQQVIDRLERKDSGTERDLAELMRKMEERL